MSRSMDGEHEDDCFCGRCADEIRGAFVGVTPNRRCRQCGSVFVWHICGGGR